MTRHRFGSSADYVVSVGTGNVATLNPGTSVTCWNAASGGTQYTDLMDTDGVTPISGGTLTADSVGAVPEFFGPDGVRSLYLDANGGSGPRRRTVATDVGEDLTTLESAAVPKATVTGVGDLLVGSGPSLVDHVAVGGSGQVLMADSLAALRMGWGYGWRRRDLPDTLLAETLSTEAPTISVAQQSTSTIASAQALLAPDTGPFRYLGAGGFQFGTVFPDTTLYLPTSRYPNTYASGQGNWAFEFGTDASQFEILFKYISSATMYRITVDGRKLTDLAQSTGATATGSRHVLKVNFGTAKRRRIRFDVATMPFGGLFLPPGATAWKVARRGARTAILGDSISDGSAQNAGAGIGTWTYKAGRMLGCTDVWDQSRGGTGYITAGSYAVLGDRVALDITPYSIERLIIFAGYNDNTGSQSAIGAAADSLYASVKTACVPGADIYVIGCWSPTGSPATSIINTDNTLKTSATNAGLPFISPVTGSVYDKAGNLLVTNGPWITSANASTYIGADGVHPTDAGHDYLAYRITDSVRVTMPV